MAAARAVVRSLILQLAAWVGPADWRLIVVAHEPRNWDWCGWLPHNASADGTAMVVAADHPDAEAVLVPDTAMHTMAFVDKLQAAVGKPVLTANQVTVLFGDPR